jgi:hypothetical protein
MNYQQRAIAAVTLDTTLRSETENGRNRAPLQTSGDHPPLLNLSNEELDRKFHEQMSFHQEKSVIEGMWKTPYMATLSN